MSRRIFGLLCTFSYRTCRFSSTSSTAPLFGLTKYGGRRTVTLIPGDGIGPELTACVRELFSWIKVPIDFEVIDFHGADADAEDRINDAVTSIRRNGIGLKGILSTPHGRATRTSLNIKLRTELDLFANVIVCKTPKGLKTRHKNVDIVIIRQNTEAEYTGLEHEIFPGVIESLKVISRQESMRIAKFAFDFAAQVSRPQQFDVLVTPNLYGNIVGNIGAGLVGGAGIVPGYNISNDFAVFEPGARQLQESLTGKGVANPICMLSTSAMMLRHVGMDTYAEPIQRAVQNVLDQGQIRTPDMGGTHTTEDMSRAVIDEVDRLLVHATSA